MFTCAIFDDADLVFEALNPCLQVLFDASLKDLNLSILFLQEKWFNGWVSAVF
jgi:hypothetical protein